ncbi:MAG: hypothetical protein JO208_16040, partial [Alphaproteobacteria bacterium]|nr:hypothetical protein [Alphaproteobacteria bacterium]
MRVHPAVLGASVSFILAWAAWAEPQPGQPAPDPNAPINAQAIETAKLDPNNPEGSRELLVRIEVLLDRA